MGDGWETRRRRSPGYDWIIIKLGTATKINKILVDTTSSKAILHHLYHYKQKKLMLKKMLMLNHRLFTGLKY